MRTEVQYYFSKSGLTRVRLKWASFGFFFGVFWTTLGFYCVF